MNKPLIYGLIITACNVIAFVLLIRVLDGVEKFMGSILIGLPGIVLFTELVLGLVFSYREKKKPFGMGLLMSVALTMFIALVAGIAEMATFTW